MEKKEEVKNESGRIESAFLWGFKCQKEIFVSQQ
jgi:hypothetical protein